MRLFIVTMIVSVGGTILFWNFGLAHRLWGTHPLLATTLVVTAAATAIHLMPWAKSAPNGEERFRLIATKLQVLI